MIAIVVFVACISLLIGGSDAFRLTPMKFMPTTSKTNMHPENLMPASNRRYYSVSNPLRSNMKIMSYRSSETIVADEEEEHDEEEEEEEEESAQPVPIIEQEDSAMSLIKEGIKFPTSLNGSDVRVGIIMGRWNADVIQGLYKGVNESLTQCGVKPSNVFTTYVPGSYELPITAKFLAASKRVDVIICLGCLIKGETMHFEYIAQATANGIMQVSLDSYVPCVFGVLTVLNKEQAVKRSTGTTNEGLSWGRTAVEMGLARLSALGLDRKQKTDSDATPFVTFNATMPAKANEGNTTSATTKKPRKFGF